MGREESKLIPKESFRDFIQKGGIWCLSKNLVKSVLFVLLCDERDKKDKKKVAKEKK